MHLPFVRELFADAERTAAFQRVAPLLRGRAGRRSVSGLTLPARALHLPLFYKAAGHPLLVLVENNRAAEELFPLVRAFADLTGALPPKQVLKLPSPDVLPFENLSTHAEIQEERAATLVKIAAGEAGIVIAPFEAAAMRLFPAEFYAGLARTLRRGESAEPEAITAHLNLVGYSPADLVEMPGQYALRGGILDVYPPETERPLRIEFFGDEVESIRRFDPGTQRSASPLEEAALLPFQEVPVKEEILAAIHARLSGGRIAGDISQSVAAMGVSLFPGWECYAAVAGADQSLFDLLPDALVFVDEPTLVRTAADKWWQKLTERHERSGVGNLIRPDELASSPDDFWQRIANTPGLEMEELGMSGGEAIDFHSQPCRKFHGVVTEMAEEVKKLTEANTHVVFAAAHLGDLERLADLFGEYGLHYRLGTRPQRMGSETFLDDSSFSGGDLSAATLVKLPVPHGFVLPEAGLAFFGAHDLFDESEMVATRPLKSKSKVSAFLSDFRDLVSGDYVVHVEHGIAVYRGLKEIQQGEEKNEFMLLEFAEEAKLYVPLTRLDLIQKYRSTEGAKPPLSRLGGAAWAKTKARVKKAMQDMADELLKLYAQRRLAEGHAFPADTQFQREFEDAFEYSDTDDQITATAEIKHDMESSMPMDRLLCGDVGFGKTEVAMRAAFKAVSDGKQVAVLAPTTVLAFQHFETFKQRFAAFPITVEMLSRFRNAKQQKEIVERVEATKVDILIGTHRLLSKDVKMPNLGLLIVDEEQRFGVRHKERLKQMRKEVDVLAMSATPIPRTLHMSLVGLRDMSMIETPPRDRMAIQTVVAAFDDQLMKAAIEHELDRGGQIYFVHNRVESIYEIAAHVQKLAPKARVLVGHGQMPESELEKTMLAFAQHKADVLVATTIIENGLDIPLCNTIFINRADRHGLSELYQLRGRVGRSDRRAYAYLLVPHERELTPIARQRLAALKEFSDLGAGFKIAALDLELRGAGNMLGGEQSGHIESIGFEMYTTMLERTVREMKGEIEAETLSTQMNLALNLRLPHGYVTEENQRLRLYKRIAGAENEDQLREVEAEIADRFGPLPAPVRNLLDGARLKLLCQRVGVAQLDRRQNTVHLRFTESAAVDPARLMQFVAANKGAQFSPGGTLKFVLKSTAAEDVLGDIKKLLIELSMAPMAEAARSSE